MQLADEAVARMLFKRRAIAFDFTPNGGFALDVHSRGYPDAPRSPFFLSIRTPTSGGEKKGNLTDGDIRMIAAAMVSLCQKESPGFDCLAGVPHAADPIVEAMARLFPNPRPIIQLEKVGEGASRVIRVKAGQKFFPGQWVLLCDDLITRGTSKRAAIDPLLAAGLLVSDLVVLVDRESGGAADLAAFGVKLHAVFTASELFSFARDEDLITPAQYDRVMAYPALLTTYISSHEPVPH